MAFGLLSASKDRAGGHPSHCLSGPADGCCDWLCKESLNKQADISSLARPQLHRDTETSNNTNTKDSKVEPGPRVILTA